MTSRRLDAAVAERGLARSRSHAQRLISRGEVLLEGAPAERASTRVAEDAVIEVVAAPSYVSRAAAKLVAALDAFRVDPSGRLALDMGASTGGFTQVLRERGATPVIAVDVGHGQLAAEVAADRGVIAVEGFNVRHMTPRRLADASGVAARPRVVTADLSFISLRHVLPAVAAVAAADADLVMLVKPQFEVGPGRVRAGVVTDPAARAEAVMGVLDEAARSGLATIAVAASPVVGTHGNLEFLVHLTPSAPGDPTQWRQTVDRLVTGER